MIWFGRLIVFWSPRATENIIVEDFFLVCVRFSAFLGFVAVAIAIKDSKWITFDETLVTYFFE